MTFGNKPKIFEPTYQKKRAPQNINFHFSSGFGVDCGGNFQLIQNIFSKKTLFGIVFIL